MEYLQGLFYAIGTIAAALYIVDRYARGARQRARAQINKQVRTIAHVGSESAEAIRVPFELWWDENVRPTVLSSAKKKLVEQIPDGVPEEMRVALLDILPADMIVDQAKDAAFHLAVHAYSRTKEDALIESIKWHPAAQKEIKDELDEHRESLNGHRTFLASVGVDADMVEKEFFEA